MAGCFSNQVCSSPVPAFCAPILITAGRQYIHRLPRTQSPARASGSLSLGSSRPARSDIPPNSQFHMKKIYTPSQVFVRLQNNPPLKS
eukprot:scaffold11551_cov112-Isochrysis_galbana.AAC.3